MPDWISSRIKSQQEVGDALKNLAEAIRRYEDAANPKYCRGTSKRFLRAELDWFRPGWKHFMACCILLGVAGIILALLRPSFNTGLWSNLSLFVTVPVFVLGVSIVMLARSMSESGRFAAEYVNESCKMELFCCLTLIAVLIAFVGQFLSTITWFPKVITATFCSASMGATIDCLAMLAFVVRETIRCSVPSESIRVVSKFAARKLCYGYLKEAYLRLFQTQHKDYLEKWCAEKTIHPPSQYYGHYFRSSLHAGEGANDIEIKLDGLAPGENSYKDYDLESLAALDKYLKDNNAELYLSSPIYESERRTLGILSSKNSRLNETICDNVSRMGKEVVRFREFKFIEEGEDFWDSQESKLGEAVEMAVDKADPVQLRAYLDAVNEPHSVLRHARNNHRVIRDAYGEHVQRGYDFIRLYLRSLCEVLDRQEGEPKHRAENIMKLMRNILSSIWTETKEIFQDMDYHTMELFTWLVPQMYRVIQDVKEKTEPLHNMRAQFGGFYEFAAGWLEDASKRNPEDVNRMRLVIHDGMTKWLLIAIKEKDTDLIEQLCDAGRKIVFGRDEIEFNHREAVAQHFVLAGRLISMSKAGEVNAAAVEKMFFERHSRTNTVDFDKLVRFYLDNSLPVERLDTYLNIFYSPKTVRSDLFTGSSHSSGFGMTGVSEISRAFIYLAANAQSMCEEEPAPIAEMADRISDKDIQVVEEVFKGSISFSRGIKQLRNWLKKCTELNQDEEAREIATASLDKDKVEEHKQKFWDGYSRAVPVLSLCLRNGSYKIDNNVSSEWRYTVPKMALFNWKYPLSGADGDEYGMSLGRSTENILLHKMVEKADAESNVKGGFSELIIEAAKWLEKQGCSGDNGIIIAASRLSPSTKLFSDKNFVPSWKEEVRSLGFDGIDGFYSGFPVVWYREGEKMDEVEVAEKASEPKSDRVGAVDIRGWTGIGVREDVASKKKFGELEIREWSKQEIDKAIESGKLDTNEVDKAKGNCPVDISFFWEFSGDELPRRKIFSIAPDDPQKEKEAVKVQ